MKFSTAAVVLTLAILCAMGPLLGANFLLWDDPSNLWQQPALASVSASSFAHAWTSTDDAIYMPLTRTLWLALAPLARQEPDWTGSTLSPAVYHLASLVVHGVASCLVFRLLRRIGMIAVPALIGAAVFAIHPLQVESVGWASGLKDVLAGTLALASLNLYVDAAVSDEPRRYRQRYIASVVAFACAVLAKPTALVVPLLIVLIATLALRRPVRKLALELAPMLALSLLAAITVIVVQPSPLVPHVAPHLRPLVAADALMFYARQVLWPAALAVDYGRTPQVVLNSDAGWLGSVKFICLIGGAIVIRRRVTRLGTLGPLLFVAALMPVLGWTPFEFQIYSTVADHYVYLAMVGVALLVASIAARLDGPIVRVVCGIALLALGVRAHLQARAWHDTETLARHALTVNDRSAVNHRLLGANHDLQAAWHAKEGRPAETVSALRSALIEYDAALAIDAGDVRTLDDAAKDAWRLHRLANSAGVTADLQRAFDYWKRLDSHVAELPPAIQANFVELPARLGKLALDLNQNDAAAAYFARALVLRPHDANAQAGATLAAARLRATASTLPADASTPSAP